MKLNLGSGGKPLSGYMNVDKNPRAPVVWNHFLESLFNRFLNVYEQSPLLVFPALSVHAELVK
jgi:hypothetical protein